MQLGRVVRHGVDVALQRAAQESSSVDWAFGDARPAREERATEGGVTQVGEFPASGWHKGLYRLDKEVGEMGQRALYADGRERRVAMGSGE